MARTLPTGIAAAYTQPGAYPGYLLRIYVTLGITELVIRLTSLDRDFTYEDELYTSIDCTVPDISWDGTVEPGAQLLFGDMDIILWVANLYRHFDNAPVEIDGVYFGADDEVVPMFRGRAGKPQRKVAKDGETFTLSLDAEATALYAPRTRVQDVVDKKWLIPAGTTFVVNSQQWVLARRFTRTT